MKQLPSADEVVRIRREALLNRAVEAYKFFYPTVSMASELRGDRRVRSRGEQRVPDPADDSRPRHAHAELRHSLRARHDDLSAGPVVVEVPPGPIMGVADDMNFQLVTNMGLVGVEEGKGAKYLFVPPDTTASSPRTGTS